MSGRPGGFLVGKQHEILGLYFGDQRSVRQIFPGGCAADDLRILFVIAIQAADRQLLIVQNPESGDKIPFFTFLGGDTAAICATQAFRPGIFLVPGNGRFHCRQAGRQFKQR